MAPKYTLDGYRGNHRWPAVLFRLTMTHLAIPATRSSLTRRTEPTEIPLCCRIDNSPIASTNADCCPADNDVCVYSDTTVCWQPARHLWQWERSRGNIFEESSETNPRGSGCLQSIFGTRVTPWKLKPFTTANKNPTQISSSFFLSNGVQF